LVLLVIYPVQLFDQLVNISPPGQDDSKS